jgi:hypothetical protein
MARYRVWLGRTEKPFSRVVEADDMMVNDRDQLVLFNRGTGNAFTVGTGTQTVAIFRQGAWSYVREIQ